MRIPAATECESVPVAPVLSPAADRLPDVGLAGHRRDARTPGERTRICEQATAAAARATEQIQAGTDPHAAADAAWAASDFLPAAGRVVVGRTENQQLLARLAQLVALTDAVTRLRENQDRAAQATAARSAAEQLRLTGAQRASVPPGAPAATATRSRQPDFSYDLGRPGPGPVQGPPDTRRGPRR